MCSCSKWSTMNKEQLLSISPDMSKREIQKLKKDSNRLENEEPESGSESGNDQRSDVIDVTDFEVIGNESDNKDDGSAHEDNSKSALPERPNNVTQAKDTEIEKIMLEKETALKRATDAERRVHELERSLKQSQDAHKSKTDIHKNRISSLQTTINDLKSKLESKTFKGIPVSEIKNKITSRKKDMEDIVSSMKKMHKGKKIDEIPVNSAQTMLKAIGYMACVDEFIELLSVSEE